MTKNSESTRFFSDKHEKSVCKELGAYQTPNSGASHFRKGDCYTDNMLIECKCSMSPKTSFSIKKEWIEKNREEAFSQRKSNSCLAFNFEPDGENFYVISSKLMKFLVEKLEEEK